MNKRARILALGAVAVLVTAAGAAYAAIPGSNGTIQGCYGKVTGNLRVIDVPKSEKCSRLLEEPLAWSQQGPKGDKGDKGDPGSPGQPGSSTVAGYSTTVQAVTLAGRTSVASKTLPPGKYILMATIELVNRDLDSTSLGSCELTRQSGLIASTGIHSVDDIADFESLALSAVIDHGGGSILLVCTETQADLDVDGATLVAIKVDSLG